MKLTAIISAVMIVAGSTSAFAFGVTSTDIKPGHKMSSQHELNGYGCTGDNVSPQLAWDNPPEGTESYAVFVHDEDAASGGAGFWHWVVIDIPADVTSLASGAGSEGGAIPEGARQMATDFGVPGWGGPCPPVGDGDHNYSFTVYALPVAALEVPDEATASLTGFVVNSIALGKTTLKAKYHR